MNERIEERATEIVRMIMNQMSVAEAKGDVAYEVWYSQTVIVARHHPREKLQRGVADSYL